MASGTGGGPKKGSGDRGEERGVRFSLKRMAQHGRPSSYTKKKGGGGGRWEGTRRAVLVNEGEKSGEKHRGGGKISQ